MSEMKFLPCGRRSLQVLLGLAVAGLMAACGGGGSASGQSPFVPPPGASAPTTPPTDLVVVLDKTTVTNLGTETVGVTVTAIDANRNAVSNAAVTFAVDANAVVTPAGTVTDTSGALKANVQIGADHTNRKVSVKAVSGTISRTVTFDVVDPPASATTPTAARITIALDRSNVGNSGVQPVTVTVTAATSAGVVLSGIPITLAINNNGTITPGGSTNAQGVVTATANIGADKSNRVITVTATSGTLVQTAAFQVTGAQLQGQAVPSLPVASSTGNQIQYVLTDVNKNPMAGLPISVSGAGVASATGTTDINGAYVYTYTAPAVAGAVNITATAGGATANVTVTVPSSTSIVPNATPAVTSVTLSASPTVVAVNSSTTSNLSAISALFLGANNTPVKNVRVRFDLNGDVNSIGGTLGSGASMVYSDASGNVTTNYVPSTRSSPTDGVTIRACWDAADFSGAVDAAGKLTTCPNAKLITLTVVSQPLSITIGNDENVTLGNGGLTLIKNFVVLVVDASGSPKANVQITPSIDLVLYGKGYYTWNALDNVWEITRTATCLNEDTNRNGVIESGEDINGNGQLDPRKSDVSISMVGSTVTDANGTGVMQIQYPKSLASWVMYRITASAAGVLSPPAYSPGPSSAAALPVDASSVTTHIPAPAYVTSPYGVANSCTIAN